ncbi:hypothetical protein BLNAU_10161 [Blattamonas nauphoetae]|uniref:Uncharacterized protein n=1 Tax=Blattamonas nauphoetae TaxID=2049346 RepID=A0ABQ9XTM5_9EUKA|nr:hypothetical protein BLNAU_10161 [Blattamonas nauphoetae]
MIDPEYSPFLYWNPNDPITIDSVVPPFNSLVSMVTDSYKFDEKLVTKASTFLSSVDRTFGRSFTLANDLLKSIAQNSPNAAEVSVAIVTICRGTTHAMQHWDY